MRYASSRFGQILACLILVFASAAALPIAAARSHNDLIPAFGPRADLAFETSDFMRLFAWSDLGGMKRDGNDNGAVGKLNQAFDETHIGRWYIEEQRTGTLLIAGGIANDDRDAVDRGLQMLEWGAAQEQPDGSFKCPDQFHSTSFFLEGASHGCLLLLASKYAEEYRSRIDALKPKILLTARWMMRPEVEAKGRPGNAPYGHRRYLVAAALGEAGVLCHDDESVRKSVDYAREGLALQTPEGWNPEKGGWDSSYHAVGVMYAEQYYVLAAPDDLRPALYEMLRKAAAWSKSRIQPDGTPIVEGNTRIGGNGHEKRRDGTPKQVGYGQIMRTFADWTQISGDASYLALAEKVAQYDRDKKVRERRLQ